VTQNAGPAAPPPPAGRPHPPAGKRKRPPNSGRALTFKSKLPAGQRRLDGAFRHRLPVPAVSVKLWPPLEFRCAGQIRIFGGKVWAVIVQRTVRPVLPIALPPADQFVVVGTDSGNGPFSRGLGVSEERQPGRQQGGNK